MSRQLSEAEAWREIARRVAERGLISLGLCREVTQLGFDDATSLPTLAAMRRRVNRHLDTPIMEWRNGDGPTPKTVRHDVRVLAALLLAEEAEGEL